MHELTKTSRGGMTARMGGRKSTYKITQDLHDWGFDPQADIHVVELQVAWNTGSTHSHYEWELEVIDVET